MYGFIWFNFNKYNIKSYLNQLSNFYIRYLTTKKTISVWLYFTLLIGELKSNVIRLVGFLILSLFLGQDIIKYYDI